MNALDADIMELIGQAIALVGRSASRRWSIYNEGSNFSVGANLGLALFALNIAAWGEIEKLVARRPAGLQGAEIRALPGRRRARRHGARRRLRDPAALRRGPGACRDLYRAWSNAASASIPGWGGCKEMLQRWHDAGALPQGPDARRSPRCSRRSRPRRSPSRPPRPRSCCSCAPSDGITMNRDRLLADAKAKALALADGYTPPEPPDFSLPGAERRRSALDMAVAGFRTARAWRPTMTWSCPTRSPRC